MDDLNRKRHAVYKEHHVHISNARMNMATYF